VSLQREKSEPAESDERRLPCFSSSSASECSSLGCEGDARVRRGMVSGSRGFEEGMVPVVWAGHNSRPSRVWTMYRGSGNKGYCILAGRGGFGMDQQQPRW